MAQSSAGGGQPSPVVGSGSLPTTGSDQLPIVSQVSLGTTMSRRVPESLTPTSRVTTLFASSPPSLHVSLVCSATRRLFSNPALRRAVRIMSTDDHKKDVLKKFGLNEKGATDALKNAELTGILLKMDEQFSASKLLYSVATKAHTEAHRDLLGQYVKDEKIATSQQLECALAFLKGHPEVASGDAAFEKDCGVGVTVMDEEIAAAVAKAFEEDKAAIEEDRYQYNFGSMLGRLTKTDHIKWANPTKVKAELDKQTLAVLGPKTEADAQAGKKKKEKAKPAAKTEKVKKPSAAEVAMQKEAEQMAKMTEAAKAAMSTFLYKPRLCRIKQLLDDASKGVFPDENQEVAVCVGIGWWWCCCCCC